MCVTTLLFLQTFVSILYTCPGTEWHVSKYLSTELNPSVKVWKSKIWNLHVSYRQIICSKIIKYLKRLYEYLFLNHKNVSGNAKQWLSKHGDGS
jgi:hypothetical protein